MRVFFAIEFEEEIKEYLAYHQQVVQNHSIRGNFTRLDNFHLTLKFIGEIEEKDISSLKEAIDILALRHKNFCLTTKSLGSFPRGNKQIIWIGLETEPLLENLYMNLEDMLAVIGYERENRPYRPHITLGREILLKNSFTDIQSMMELETKTIKVHKVSLMESTRVKGQLTYLPLYSKVLKGGDVENGRTKRS